MDEVRSGTLLADQARESLEDISKVVRHSSELMEEIFAASEEQARVTTNLAMGMQTVSGITIETSSGATQTAQTIQAMVNLSEQLNLTISKLKVVDNFVHPFMYPSKPSRPGPSSN